MHYGLKLRYTIIGDEVMAKHGKIGQFNPSIESWESYAERLTYYFTANDIEDDKKHSIFLTVCGAPTFQLLQSLVQPEKLEDVTYSVVLVNYNYNQNIYSTAK